MIGDRFTRTIGVYAITGSTTDGDGNPVPVETLTSVVGHWRQLSADELGPDEIGRTVYRVYMPADTVVDAGGRLDLDGVIAEVDGTPQPIYNPRTSTTDALICRAEVTR